MALDIRSQRLSSCHRKKDASKKASMRIYLQILIAGTQYQSPQA